MKRVISLILVFVLLVSLVPMSAITASAATTMTEEEFAKIIDDLKKEYPDGKYWNKNNGTTKVGGLNVAKAGNDKCTDHSSVTTCGEFYGWQCHGFANLMAYKVFGSYATKWTNASSDDDVNENWKYYKNVSTYYAGDFVRTIGGHSIFVTKVENGKIYYVDCNYIGKCQINWDGIYNTINALKSTTLFVVRYKNNTLNGTGSATPILSVRYHANGATIPDSDVVGYQYEITESVGLNMRSGPGTNYGVVSPFAKGKKFEVKVEDTKYVSPYTWGKTTIDGKTGWVVISDFVSKIADLRSTPYYLKDSLVYRTSDLTAAFGDMTCGETYSAGLFACTTFGLSKPGYTFVGWSKSPLGEDPIDETLSIKPEDIVPELKDGSQSITLYAAWVPAYTNTFAFDANGGIGAMGTISAKAGEEITLLKNQYTKEDCRFVGWNVKRENDNTWYVAGKGWISEAQIQENSYSKKLYSDETILELDYSWFRDFDADEALRFTFYAVWKDATVQSIDIAKIEKKNVYYVNDRIDVSAIELTVEKNDGSFETVTSGFAVSPEVLTREGTQTVTIGYKDLETTFTVQVTADKSTDILAQAKEDVICYYLPNTNASLFYPSAFAGDKCAILCQEGDYYLGFFPFNASSATKSNGFLGYMPKNSFYAPNGTVPSSSAYYSLNPTGTKNAIANQTVMVYHRPATTSVGSGGIYTSFESLSENQAVRVLFAMDDYYCVQTDKSTGFVAKHAITLDKTLCGIRVAASTTDFALRVQKGNAIDTSSLCVEAMYSDNSCSIILDYDIDLPDTLTIGTKYAKITYQGFSAFVPVVVETPVITEFSVIQTPDKVKYALNEALDLAGLQLQITYEDGSTEVITEGYEVETDVLSYPGYIAIPVEFSGWKTYFSVFVYEPLLVQTENVYGYQGQTVSVPITYSSITSGANSYSMLLGISYDTVNLQYRGYVASGSIDAGCLIVNPNSDGKIIAAYASDTEIAANEVLFELQFRISGEVTDGSEYFIRIDTCDFYDDDSNKYQVQIENGGVTSRGLIKINYNVGEGGNAPVSVDAKYGDQIVISDVIPIREGYVFEGWTTSPYGGTVQYTAGNVMNCVDHITLYAVWKEDLILGDIDGDGSISDWDGIVLARYLAGWDVEIPNPEALDLDSDGEITDWDGVLLDRILAGWDIKIG